MKKTMKLLIILVVVAVIAIPAVKDNLILHEDILESGEMIAVLSGTIFEYDGRGEIIIAEFVSRDDLDKLPEDYRSELCKVRNDREPS